MADERFTARRMSRRHRGLPYHDEIQDAKAALQAAPTHEDRMHVMVEIRDLVAARKLAIERGEAA